jgi:hypothetical protein
MKQLIKKLTRRALNSVGYDLKPLFRDAKQADIDEEARRAIAVVRPATMVPDTGLWALWRQVRYCEERALDGVFVECGVWNGGACGLMALANLRYGKQRRHIHLFDAFADICQPDPQVDGERAVREAIAWAGMNRRDLSGALKPMTGFYAHKGGHGRVDVVRKLLEQDIGYPAEFVHCHEGWFQDTLPLVAPSLAPVALLRLDGDYYASTKVCLDHLVQKVIPGGFIIIDDYGVYEGCRRAVDEFLEHAPSMFLHQSNAAIHYLVKAG